MRSIWPTIVVALSICACTAPPEGPGTIASEPTPELAIFPQARPPDAPKPPNPPDPACPARRVFASVEELCDHAIMPSHPFGVCEPLQLSDVDEDDREFAFTAVRLQVAALGGRVELVSKSYIGSGDSEQVTVYLVLRQRDGGYVLLTALGSHDSQANNPLHIDRFEGDAEQLEVEFTQEWFYDDQGEFEPKTRTSSLRCSATPTGIVCGDACPTLGLVHSMPALDCAALASFDWSTLPRSVDILDEFGGRFDDDQAYLAMRAVGVEPELDPPISVRSYELPHDSLTVLEPVRGKWVLMHDQVPLVTSAAEIRVGDAPGGLYVSSRANGKHRIQRLNLDTHELEAVLPGACGSSAP